MPSLVYATPLGYIDLRMYYGVVHAAARSSIKYCGLVSVEQDAVLDVPAHRPR